MGWTAESPGCQEWQVLDLVIQWGTEAGLLGTVWEKTVCEIQQIKCDVKQTKCDIRFQKGFL